MKVESGKLTIWREISWRLAIESSACWFAQDAAGRTSKLADYTLEVYTFVPEQALDDFLVELCKRAVLGLANPDPLVIESGDAYFAEKTSGRKKKKFQVAALYRPKIVFNRKRRTYREYFVIVVMIFDTRTKLFLEINFASFKGTKRRRGLASFTTLSRYT